MNEVAVVEGLQAEVGELLIPFRLQRVAQGKQIEVGQIRIEQLELDATFNECCSAAG